MKEFFKRCFNEQIEVTMLETVFTALMGISAALTGDIFLATWALAFYEYESYMIGFNIPK